MPRCPANSTPATRSPPAGKAVGIDHADDPGGKTNWGVTQDTLSKFLGRPATEAEIRGLTQERAKAIYAAMFWDTVGGDVLPAGVDLCVYDFGVNSGPSRAVKSLQAALGVVADGWVGDKTVEALARANPGDADQRSLRSPLGLHEKIRHRKTKKLLWDSFGKGWGNRVADIRKQAIRMANGAKPMPPVAPVSALALPRPCRRLPSKAR